MSKTIAKGGTDRFNLMLSLTGHLISNRRVPLRELAQHFGVSEKEIRAALVTISLSGVGGYRPDELFFIDYDLLDAGIVDLSFAPAMEEVPRLSMRQASAISAGLIHLRAIVGDNEKLEIESMLRLLAEGSSASIPAISVGGEQVQSEIALVREAIYSEKRISCKYRNSAGEISVRQVDPLLLESDGTNWFLRGYCLKNLEVRTFRMDRLAEASILSVDVSPEAKKSSLSEGVYTIGSNDTEVTFEIRPEALGLVSDFQAEQDLGLLPNGSYTAKIRIGHLPKLGKIVSRYGGTVKVLAPPSARKLVMEYARGALGLNNPKSEPEEA
jgi:proteasome accessory factor C